MMLAKIITTARSTTCYTQAHVVTICCAIIQLSCCLYVFSHSAESHDYTISDPAKKLPTIGDIIIQCVPYYTFIALIAPNKTRNSLKEAQPTNQSYSIMPY